MAFIFKKKKKGADKYRIGMEKTRTGPFSRLKRLFSGYNEITEDFFDELEETNRTFSVNDAEGYGVIGGFSFEEV